MIEALAGASGRDVSRETFSKIERYVALLLHENSRQNLIGRSTADEVWQRHILDSAQLCRYIPRSVRTIADVGSGAGLPGLVLACLVPVQVHLIEPRRLRADFLARAADQLGLPNAMVMPCKSERVDGRFDVITGRAVANLAQFLRLSAHLSTEKTTWVLPKGRNAVAELASAKRSWHGLFHVERSLTDGESFIIVGERVKARRG